MPTKIFATGVTGYIGGDAIYAIATAHPEYDFTCLVRNSDKAAAVAAQYANFKFAYGDLESVGLIEEEAGKADIVLNFADADNVPALEAIIRGLTARASSKPGFLIHTSGTGTLMHADIQAGRYGEPSSTIFDDLSGLNDVRAIPTGFSHRDAEELILTTGAKHADKLKTAIVAPPCIYGTGRGPANQRSMQIPELVRCTLEKGHGITVGRGKNVWSGVHVHDLSALYLKLVENAAAGESLAEWAGKPALWGEEGLFFCESGEEVRWDEVAGMVVEEAKKAGFLGKGADVREVGKEEAAELTHRGDVLWGCNSRGKALRAREALGWQAKAMGVKEVVREQIGIEADRMGLRVGHAKVAAGEA